MTMESLFFHRWSIPQPELAMGIPFPVMGLGCLGNLNSSAIKGDDFLIKTMIPGFGRTVRSWWNLPRWVVYCFTHINQIVSICLHSLSSFRLVTAAGVTQWMRFWCFFGPRQAMTSAAQGRWPRTSNRFRTCVLHSQHWSLATTPHLMA